MPVSMMMWHILAPKFLSASSIRVIQSWAYEYEFAKRVSHGTIYETVDKAEIAQIKDLLTVNTNDKAETEDCSIRNLMRPGLKALAKTIRFTSIGLLLLHERAASS